MKIGIFTFHRAHNYGAVLQAYALQETLKGLGHEVEIIDYRPDYLEIPYKPFVVPSYRNRGFFRFLRSFIVQIVLYPIKRIRYNKFNRFILEKLNLSKERITIGDPLSISYDAIIWGSDQIWNPEITKGYDPIFCGELNLDVKTKKIAYAGSTEGKDIKTKDIHFLIANLREFNSLSVREFDLAQRLHKELNLPVPVVLDPTLLSDVAFFDQIAINPLLKNPYILTYQVRTDSTVDKVSSQIAATKSLDVKDLDAFWKKDNIFNDLMTSSPEEFLGLVKHASYIVTTSFHGVAFSIIFRKQFICVLNENYGNSRIRNVLQMFNLEDRIYSEQNFNTVLFRDINYDDVHSILTRKRTESLDFLLEALK